MQLQQELFKEPTTNFCEMAVLELLRGRGWEVERNGLPDFMIVKNGVVKGCEVKPKNGKLSKAQRKMKKIFEMAGIPYIVLEVTKSGNISKSVESS